MRCPHTHTKLHRRVPRQGNHQDAEGRHHDSHRNVGHRVRVGIARLELETTVITGEQARQSNEHFAEGRVDVEVELALEIVRSEFAKVCLIPDDSVVGADTVESSVA